MAGLLGRWRGFLRLVTPVLIALAGCGDGTGGGYVGPDGGLGGNGMSTGGRGGTGNMPNAGGSPVAAIPGQVPGPEVARLRACGLLTSAPTNALRAGATGQAMCREACNERATCEELAQLYCMASPGPALRTCYQACFTGTFSCADGTTIRISDRCDRTVHCPDGSDEVGCRTFACADGTLIPANDQCDGGEACADGSDEIGCPTFTCADGHQIGGHLRCDLRGDCGALDISDEAGCAVLVCQ